MRRHTLVLVLLAAGCIEDKVPAVEPTVDAFVPRVRTDFPPEAGPRASDAAAPAPARDARVAVDAMPARDAEPMPDARPRDAGMVDVAIVDAAVVDVAVVDPVPDTAVVADAAVDGALADVGPPPPACEPDGQVQLRAEDPERRRQVADTGFCAGAPGASHLAYTRLTPEGRTCVALEGEPPADLRLTLHPLDASGSVCQPNHPQCAAGAVCVPTGQNNPAARCSAWQVHSDHAQAVEVAALEAGHGSLMVRVARDGQAAAPYRLTVSQPPAGPCGRDWREGPEGNDSREAATPLGDGAAGVCDAWICADEQDVGDWYTITVPPGADRTVVVSYRSRTEGELTLEAFGAPESPPMLADHRGDGHQCLNLRGGAAVAEVALRVRADWLHPDRDRVDYTLRVLPTDLRATPTGACRAITGLDLEPCPAGAPGGPHCWPTLEVP